MEAVGVVLEAVGATQASKSGVVVVAVDGFSAAGKSTIANAIADRIAAAVVHCDDFYRDMVAKDRLGLTAEEGVDRYFDSQRLRHEALTPLVRRRRANFARFDWIAGEGLTGVVSVEPRDVVVVEGVYSARPELEDLVDLKVLVEASLEERAGRRRKRHDPWEWEGRWDAAERLYFEAIRPWSAFDLVVRGDE